MGSEVLSISELAEYFHGMLDHIQVEPLYKCT